MDERLDDNDLDVILDSLKHYKARIENQGEYPSYGFKQEQLDRVETAMRKVKALKQGLGKER